jgi:cytochrome c553
VNFINWRQGDTLPVWLLFSLLLLGLLSTSAVSANANEHKLGYVGATACQGCHQSEYNQWQQSDHFKAMQVASKDTVLGDFANTEVEFHDIKTRFHSENGQYKITTTNKKNQLETFDVPYTFGFYPLQQYLVDVGEGKLQAFNVAWDSRSEDEGGQRWYHLQPVEKITPEHPFFWQRHFQNWNSRCADCHSTDLQRNFSPKTNVFNTHFSEVNVACESCHGPASQHITLAKRDELTADNNGFNSVLPAVKNFAFTMGNPIAHADGEPNNSEINVCGRCHSLRTPLSHPFSADIGSL